MNCYPPIDHGLVIIFYKLLFEFILYLNSFFSAGIAFTNGPMWKQQRRFALFTLKYLGSGKKFLASYILDEFIYMSKQIDSYKGRKANAL